MNSFFAFMKKEWLETVRSGKFTILVILFVLFGIMNPTIAKLTPWMMEMMADTFAKSGMIVTDVQVDALTSWTQFFKNIPMGFIAFLLIYSGIFTKEYQTGALVLVLTKGLSRYKVVLAKSALLLLLWTFYYWLCFAITYGYNFYFWDNSIACHLFLAGGFGWLFGVWVIGLLVLFSVISGNNIGVLLGTGGTLLAAYLVGILPEMQKYTPTMLMGASSLLSSATGPESYTKAVIVTVILLAGCITASIPIMNRKQI